MESAIVWSNEDHALTETNTSLRGNFSRYAKVRVPRARARGNTLPPLRGWTRPCDRVQRFSPEGPTCCSHGRQPVVGIRNAEEP